MCHWELKQLPTAEWMRESQTPKLHQWLDPKQSSDSKERLKICGNIVIPAMGHFAMHILSEIW